MLGTSVRIIGPLCSFCPHGLLLSIINNREDDMATTPYKSICTLNLSFCLRYPNRLWPMWRTLACISSYKYPPLSRPFRCYSSRLGWPSLDITLQQHRCNETVRYVCRIQNPQHAFPQARSERPTCSAVLSRWMYVITSCLLLVDTLVHNNVLHRVDIRWLC